MPVRNQFKPGPEPGTKFGKLTVLSAGEPIIERCNVPTSICQCDCGKTLTIRNYVLTRKRSPRSCGCTRRHGCSTRENRTRTYDAWQNMKTRCRRDPHYEDISIYPAWVNDFEAFKRDMGECPKGLTLDRVNNKGNYEPSNCRWVDMKEQNNNRETNRLITINGTTRTVSEWMDYHGLNYTTFYRRIKLGWSEEEAAGTPKLARHSKWNRKHEV